MNKILKMHILILILMINSFCSPAKRQAHHYRKFVQYGGKIDTVKRTLEVFVPGADGKDSLIRVWVDCPEIDFPKTNTEIRQDQRTERRELRENTKQIRAIQKATTKKARTTAKKKAAIEKAKQKTERRKCHWFSFMLLGAFITLLAQYGIRRFIA